MRYWNGAVAQLGERVVRNDEVSGSIPLGSTSSPTPELSDNPAHACSGLRSRGSHTVKRVVKTRKNA